MKKRIRKWQARFRNSIGGIIFSGARRRGRGDWHCAEELPKEVIDYLHIERADGLANNWYQRDWKKIQEMHQECKPESRYWGGQHLWLVVDFTVEETDAIRPPAIDVNLDLLRATLREMNEGRNLKRYNEEGRGLGGCFDLISFGWKDADLDPGGCCGIDKLLHVSGKQVVFVVSGHKTFCDPSQEIEDDDRRNEVGDVAQEIVCGCGTFCEWDGDSWCASFSETAKAPVVHHNNIPDYEKTAKRIIGIARKIKSPYQDQWATTNEQLDVLCNEG